MLKHILFKKVYIFGLNLKRTGRTIRVLFANAGTLAKVSG